MLGWKPHPNQPKPIERGSGEVSLKDLYRLDEIVKEVKTFRPDDADKNKKWPADNFFIFFFF